MRRTNKLKHIFVLLLGLSIIRTAAAQVPSTSINGTPPPYVFNGSGVSQAGQTFTFSGGGGSGTTTVISPSGDATGATDRAAINTAIAAGGPVSIATSKGKFYIDNTGIIMATPNNVSCDSWNNVIQMEGSTGFPMHFTYDTAFPESSVSQLGTFNGCSLLLDSGVTATAGGAIQIKPKDGDGYIMIAPQMKNLLINGAFYTDIDLEGPGIIIGTYLDNVYMNHPLSTGYGCIHYNASGPGGDMNFNNSFCFGNGTQAGVTIDRSDTTSWTNLKMNGAYINFTNAPGTTTINMRFVNISIEDLTVHCPFTVASASGAIQSILVSGGEFVDIVLAGRLCSPSAEFTAAFVFTPSIDATTETGGGTPKIVGSDNSLQTVSGSGFSPSNSDGLVVYADSGTGSTVTTQIPFIAGSYLTDLAFTCEFAGNFAGTWLAFGTYPTCIRSYQGTLYFYSDSGQSFGASFVPTLIGEIGGTAEPTGACSPNGIFAITEDGHYSVCVAAVWVQKI